MMDKKQLLFSAFLFIIYAVGIIGLSLGYREMAALTPFTLLLSFVLIMLNHSGKIIAELSCLGIVFLFGFFVEVAGVATGKIFGEYYYGKNLGIKLFSVPIVIGLNWSLLVYSTAQAVRVLLSSVFPAACVGAFIMVGLDFLIEPVATQLDFWHWRSASIPVQNYIGWFVVSFIAHYFYQKFSTQVKLNKTALVLLALQFLFFGILNLTLKS